MRVRRTSFVLVALVAGSVAAQASDRPPQGLHLVNGHWTAWNPPPPAATDQVHVVAKGDTLWQLAAKYYGNAYLWPQIWEKNKYVLDAHWIYPGDPLILGLNVAPADNLTQGGPAGAGAAGTPGAPGAEAALIPAPPAGVVDAARATGSPAPLGAETDIYCQGYVGDLEETFPYAVVGSEYDALSLDNYVRGSTGWKVGSWHSTTNTVKFGLTAGDILYIDGGKERGLTAGSQFQAIQPDQPVVDANLNKVVGRYYRYVARVRILSVQPTTAIAEIVQSCDPLIVGAALLKPFEPEPVPLGRSTPLRPVNFPAAADKIAHAPSIVFSRDDVLTLGADHVVHIDVGEQDTTPGDIYTIYRENHKGLPPIVLGELAVLSVHKRFSVAKIIESRYPIRLGDRLDPK
jgi:hypothetical protein